ncbi:MAG: hypothetical protein JWR22_2764 [Herminiimonas sp.]|nr:hypothetical protein [Herminiimonas sp.]
MKRIALPLLLTVVAGCSTTPNYDAKFGDAVRSARMQMTLHPEAGSNTDQALGMDGRSAREAMVRYESTFKAPPPVTNVINIGGSIGNGRGQ